MSSEDRITELERVLEDILECVDDTPEGYEIETLLYEELVIVGNALNDALDRAKDVLYNDATD